MSNIPPGSFDASSVNRAFENVGATDYKVTSDVKVSADNIATFKVSFNTKEYHISMGSDFVAGFRGDGSDANLKIQQNFARQLSVLLATMHENPKITTGHINDHQFSYNGKSINLNDVERQTSAIDDKFKSTTEEIEQLRTDEGELTTKITEAEGKKNYLAPKKRFLLGETTLSAPDKKKYDEAEVALQKLEKELADLQRKLNTKKEELEEIKKDQTDHKAALSFKTRLGQVTVPGHITATALPAPEPASASTPSPIMTAEPEPDQTPPPSPTSSEHTSTSN